MEQTINTQDLLNYIVNSQTEKAVSIDEGYKIFMEYKAIHNRAGTCKAYRETMRPLLKHLHDCKILFTNQITDDVINRYVKKRMQEVKPVTINKEMVSLNAMLHYLIKIQLISRIHFNYEKLKTVKTKIPSVLPEDIDKCLNYFKTSKVSNKFKLIFLLILTTGIRTTESINIRNDNIDLENKRILLEFTKNGKERYIYLVDQIIPLLKSVMSSNTYLFNDNKGNQMTSDSVVTFFKHLKATLSIEILSPHKLRHYYATNLYEKSLDIYLVSKLLGHSDTKTTEIYLDINEHDNQLKNESYNPLNDFDPLTK